MHATTHIATGARVYVEYECRDIGYGVEAGTGEFTFGGQTSDGKLIFVSDNFETNLRLKRYLFPDEVIEWHYVETIELPAAMVAVRRAAAARYVVKCDECKTEIRRTDSLSESAAGGYCNACRDALDARYPERVTNRERFAAKREP